MGMAFQISVLITYSPLDTSELEKYVPITVYDNERHAYLHAHSSTALLTHRPTRMSEIRQVHGAWMDPVIKWARLVRYMYLYYTEQGVFIYQLTTHPPITFPLACLRASSTAMFALHFNSIVRKRRNSITGINILLFYIYIVKNSSHFSFPPCLCLLPNLFKSHLLLISPHLSRLTLFHSIHSTLILSPRILNLARSVGALLPSEYSAVHMRVGDRYPFPLLDCDSIGALTAPLFVVPCTHASDPVVSYNIDKGGEGRQARIYRSLSYLIWFIWDERGGYGETYTILSVDVPFPLSICAVIYIQMRWKDSFFPFLWEELLSIKYDFFSYVPFCFLFHPCLNYPILHVICLCLSFSFSFSLFYDRSLSLSSMIAHFLSLPWSLTFSLIQHDFVLMEEVVLGKMTEGEILLVATNDLNHSITGVVIGFQKLPLDDLMAILAVIWIRSVCVCVCVCVCMCVCVCVRARVCVATEEEMDNANAPSSSNARFLYGNNAARWYSYNQHGCVDAHAPKCKPRPSRCTRRRCTEARQLLAERAWDG